MTMNEIYILADFHSPEKVGHLSREEFEEYAAALRELEGQGDG